MKLQSIVLLSAIVALVAAYTTVKITMPQHNNVVAHVQQKESAYDRVMRTGTLNCGMIVFPPFIDKDINSGELKGFNVESIKKIAQLLDLKLKFTEIQLGMQKQDLESGKVDAVCADGPWFASAVKQLSFTAPFNLLPAYVYKSPDNPKITDTKSLNDPNITFIGIDGDISIDLVRTFFPRAKIQTLSSITDPSQLLMNVTTKKADVALTDVLNGDGFAKANPGQLTRVSDKPAALLKVGFTVAKDEAKLYETLNNAVEVAVNLGIMDKVLDDFDPEQKVVIRIKPY